MKIVLLDGNVIREAADLHGAFRRSLDLPDYYGNNLDALYDELSTPGEEIGIIAVNTEKLRENLGVRWERFLDLLTRVSEENDRVRALIDPFETDPLFGIEDEYLF